MKRLYAFILGMMIAGGATAYAQNPFYFTSLQLAADPDNGECLSTDGTNNIWGSCGGAGSGDNVSVDSAAVTDPDFVSTGDIDFVNTSNTITANINTGAIVNADINASAAIGYSKLNLAGSLIEPDLDADVAAVDGDYLQYDSTGTNFTWRSASEVKTDLSLNNVENTALSTWTGSTALTTVGTIGTGVWQATALTDTYVSDTLTIGAGSTVADGALSANVSLLGSTIAVSELASADFGDFTCNGVTCSLDATYLTTVDISTDTNLAAGRSLTLTGDSVAADAELYTDSKTIYIEDPTADDDLQSLWVAPVGVTITDISCESDQTVNFDLQVDDGTPAGVNGSDIACTTFATDSSLAGDTTMAAGDRLDLAITSVSGTPTWVSIIFEFTYDD